MPISYVASAASTGTLWSPMDWHRYWYLGNSSTSRRCFMCPTALAGAVDHDKTELEQGVKHCLNAYWNIGRRFINMSSDVILIRMYFTWNLPIVHGARLRLVCLKLSRLWSPGFLPTMSHLCHVVTCRDPGGGTAEILFVADACSAAELSHLDSSRVLQ